MKNMETAFTQLLACLDKSQGKTLTACFTGPRPNKLHGYQDAAAYLPISGALLGAIAGLNVLGVNRFITGGAQGIDQLALRAARQAQAMGRKLDNILYIPFPAQPSRWSASGLFSQEEYRDCVALADWTVYVSETDPDPKDSRMAAKLLTDRNHAMVADSDICIAFLTGETLADWQHATGGTAECTRYAHRHGLPILAIEYRPGEPDPFTLNVIRP